MCAPAWRVQQHSVNQAGSKHPACCKISHNHLLVILVVVAVAIVVVGATVAALLGVSCSVVLATIATCNLSQQPPGDVQEPCGGLCLSNLVLTAGSKSFRADTRAAGDAGSTAAVQRGRNSRSNGQQRQNSR
jgi:hypothetical protein